MKKLEDIYVTFTEKELIKTYVTLVEWCDDGGRLNAMLDPSDLFEQFNYLMEVLEIASEMNKK